MSREERQILTKESIKEAVSESLLEALQAAEEKQKQDSWSARSIIQILVQILQVFLIPVLAYLLLQTVNLQKEVVAIQYQIKEVDEHITEHIDDTTTKARDTASWHHTDNILPCYRCHNGNKNRVEKGTK